MKLLYIYIYNKNHNFKLYLYNLIKTINNIYNKYINIILKDKKNKNINYIINNYIDKINTSYYFQYEEKELIKYILYLNIKNKIKFNIFKNNNINFLLNLYYIIDKKNDKILKIIKGKIRNWDINRINIIDIIILKMAICEYYFIKNNNIKIIISEYINLIKIFSSPKSILFINGILDNIFKNIKLK
ncbi:MAG: hypothetical protein NHF96_00480 [Candidatus Shikimatogenerans bostrichidophilus]|nr:MAG: hypothetical protein NHF96_00480 [Candidatus Shikimatogenerans bostrichidophilus]